MFIKKKKKTQEFFKLNLELASCLLMLFSVTLSEIIQYLTAKAMKTLGIFYAVYVAYHIAQIGMTSLQEY